MALSTRAPGQAARAIWNGKWWVVGLAVFVGLTALALSFNARQREQAVTPAVVSGPRPVVAQAGVEPKVERKLSFANAGVLKEIDVAVGDRVKAGDVLAKLDTADLELKLADAQANLALQKAQIDQQVEPPAPADVQAARSAVASAASKQQDVASGASAGDLKSAQEAVAAARAGLDNARAAYQKAIAPPTTSDLAAAQASVGSAQAQLAAAQQKLDDARARPRPEDVRSAQLSVEQAKNALWSAQINRDAVCGNTHAGVQCKSQDATVAAQESAVETAQAQLDAAKLPAKPDEIAADQQGVQSAQAALDSAQAQLAKVKAGPTAADKQAAQAQVDQAAANLRSAQAKLDQLRAGATAADLAAASNAVVQARDNLDKLTRDASPATVEVGKAKLQVAQVAVAEAQQALDDAVLRAPVDGVVTSIDLHAGELVGPAAPAITVADLGSLEFRTKDLDEISAAKVRVGQPVKVTIAALDKRVFDGTVTDLAAEPTITPSGDVNYVATIRLTNPPPELRWGQTARVEFAPSG